MSIICIQHWESYDDNRHLMGLVIAIIGLYFFKFNINTLNVIVDELNFQQEKLPARPINKINAWKIKGNRMY